MSQIILLFLILVGVVAALVMKDQGYSPWWGLGWTVLMLALLVLKVIAGKRRERSDSISITQ